MFVNRPLAEVREIAECCQLDYIQLHGDETAEYCREIKWPVIKAFRVGGNFDPAAIAAYQVEWLLLDSFVPGQAGGTGIAFDWGHVRDIVGQINRPFLAAGGLTADNVAEAVRILKPWGVDVSGGVETAGAKDEEKIRQFIAAAHAAGEETGNA